MLYVCTMVVSRRGINLKLQEVQPRRAVKTEGPECIRMEGFGCDPAKIVAKDKTSQVNQVCCQSMSKLENSMELNVRTGGERTRLAGGQGMAELHGAGGRNKPLIR